MAFLKRIDLYGLIRRKQEMSRRDYLALIFTTPNHVNPAERFEGGPRESVRVTARRGGTAIQFTCEVDRPTRPRGPDVAAPPRWRGL